MEVNNQIAEITLSYKTSNKNKPSITNAADALKYFKPFFNDDTIGLQEQFCVMYLNRANKVLGCQILSKGGITGTVADPRLILATALLTAATSIILAHNHPSGNLKPSKCDDELTQKVKQAASFMDIKVLDHLIITPEEGYYSYADEGII